ncbi:GGDEF domain-containing protein [Thalassotalea euphylliae]|uniref:diguanylate cyclase n=1 Tax=Thalassotalea euphylliae TaxID=1655234 RepID=A0A3E0TPQ1_9GAMM|nr:GGDEF domain-containing protein [Thalassotalea euphylliae]REL26478.1 GGDEF domain-containing protein [Thalassotalea euphylliae]
MSETSAFQSQLRQLKAKLDASIQARSTLEEDFNKRSILLTDFLVKLSRLSKGQDLELDNRMAKLRAMLKKSAPLPDVEKELANVSKLLTQQAGKNESNIRALHQKFHGAGTTLQKAKGLPPQSRRSLRALLTENVETKDTVVQYVPQLNELLAIYGEVLAAKDNIQVSGKAHAAMRSNTVQTNKAKTSALLGNDNGAFNDPIAQSSAKGFIERITAILSSIKLSEQLQQKLNQLKNELSHTQHIDDSLLNNIVAVLNLVAQDMEQERKTAKTFLSTLSGALSKVQRAVTSTLSNSQGHRSEQEQINTRLSTQLGDIADVIDSSPSLTEAKAELMAKFEGITQTIDQKNAVELNYFEQLEQQLVAMRTKVSELEKQSKHFEQRMLEQQRMSLQDALTKLNNRAAFDEYFSKQMARFNHQQMELAVAVIDLDDFKQINDTYGHTAGDKTLQVIAATLTKTLTQNAFIARYGGEEFVLVFESLNQIEVMAALENLRKTVAKLPFKFRNNKVNITTSIGVTHIKHGDNIHLAFERADQALYQAKHQGKNQIIYAQ